MNAHGRLSHLKNEQTTVRGGRNGMATLPLRHNDARRHRLTNSQAWHGSSSFRPTCLFSIMQSSMKGTYKCMVRISTRMTRLTNDCSKGLDPVVGISELRNSIHFSMDTRFFDPWITVQLKIPTGTMGHKAYVHRLFSQKEGDIQSDSGIRGKCLQMSAMLRLNGESGQRC